MIRALGKLATRVLRTYYSIRFLVPRVCYFKAYKMIERADLKKKTFGEKRESYNDSTYIHIVLIIIIERVTALTDVVYDE